MKRALGAAAAVLGFVVLLPLVAVMAMGNPPPPAPPTPAAVADLPADVLAAAQAAAGRCGLRWEVLAAWAKLATQPTAPPMPLVAGRLGPMGLLPAIWDVYGHGDPTRPADAINATAGFLCDQGATDPARLPAAIAALAPTADVARILALADTYGTRPSSPPPVGAGR